MSYRAVARSAAMIIGLLAGAFVPAAQAAGGAGDIAGVWTLMNYKSSSLPAGQRIPQTIEGTAPPLQPWAEAIYRQRIAQSDRGEPFAPTSAYCLPLGMPLMMMAANMPIQIIQTPTQVTLLFEEQRTFRVVSLTEGHPAELDPTFYGNSVGHWEGDTLVVDTTGLNDRTMLDLTGMPHSDALHVVERIRRVDAGHLEDLITVDDPKTFTRPWTTRMRYAAFKGAIMEYVCENNRNAPTQDNHVTFLPPK